MKLTLSQIQFNDNQFKYLLENINKSKSLKKMIFQSVLFDNDFKVNLMNGFMAANKILISISLINTGLHDLEILSQMFINKKLK